MDISLEAVEASRARLGLPADWDWFPCSNNCGDIVWFGPEMAPVGDTPVLMTCSAECAVAIISR